jgi:putative DNA primase/helicase
MDRPIPTKHVDKIQGDWREVTPGERLVLHEYGAKLDAERRRKHDVILQILYDEALAKGRCYTASAVRRKLRGQAGLGGERTIRERISVLATKGYIKFFRNPDAYGLPRTKSQQVGLPLRRRHASEAQSSARPIRPPARSTWSSDSVSPTHYKCPQTGHCTCRSRTRMYGFTRRIPES